MLFNFFKKNKTEEVKTVEAVSPTRNYTGGRHWTADEDNIITSFYNLGVNPEYISEALTKAGYERSTNAVQIRISRLNKAAK